MVFYFYDNQNRLNKTEQHYGSVIVVRNYLYDENRNLQKITGSSRFDDESTIFDQTEETFGGYDNKPNPLKGPCLWQDLLYRTLSTNNFTTYSYRGSNGYNTISYTLVYGANGNVDYSK
jgi:hypothetical protein